MAYQPFNLSKRERDKLNAAIADLEAIKDDIQRAADAGVPNIEAIQANCDGKIDCIRKIKEQYSGNKK